MAVILQEITESASSSSDLMEQIASETNNQVQANEIILSKIEDVVSSAGEISSATRQQEETSGQIMQVALSLRDRSEEMKNATKEQSQTVRLLTNETEKTFTVAQEVLELILEAAESAEDLDRLSKIISTALQDNRTDISSLRVVVGSLSKQTDNIMEKLNAFILREQAGEMRQH